MAERKSRKTRTGKVVKNSSDKTTVVLIERSYPHPIYKKIVRRTRKILVHDEQNVCKPGDVVLVTETRPLSKRKNWRYVKTIRAAR